ncbi:glycosyltransferase family 4 protein [Mariniblastus fucicola]|uniref:Capsular glucan synthase n=1 Tax=Mariniblastus fucicola TaxID=980251 RepID=A0A5B9PG84_9BACT|nr:glycosyltransferase family 1 protein [Mariniblastus fucicola]QEG23606.1 Capsular glucan synthase [Mariniblastus fucicola]
MGIRSENQNGSHPFVVLYDGMIFHRQEAGGINRYFEKLIEHLPGNVRPAITLSKCPTNNFPRSKRLQLFVKGFDLPRPFRKVSRAIRATRLESIQKSLSPDLIHATYYDTLGGFDKISSGPPFVVTVHDMTHEKFPHLLDRNGKHAELKRRAIKQADAIICVSHNTRNDLLEMYPECESRTRVVYHATELGDSLPTDAMPFSDRPYILYVGSRSRYKNFDGLLRAFQIVIARDQELQLRTVGNEFTKKERQRIAELGLTDHVANEGIVDDSQLAQLYRNSLCFVYPSLYEGFGLPLLEAMSCETPVLASNNSCIPEVVRDAALLFDPNSKTDLADALTFLLQNPCVREQLVIEGRMRCSEFSWEKSARQTMQTYQTAISAARIRIGNKLSTDHFSGSILPTQTRWLPPMTKPGTRAGLMTS